MDSGTIGVVVTIVVGVPTIVGIYYGIRYGRRTDQGANHDRDRLRFLEQRAWQSEHRSSLVEVASKLYPRSMFLEGTSALSPPEWRPTAPLPADAVQVSLILERRSKSVDIGDGLNSILPKSADGVRPARYSDVLWQLSQTKQGPGLLWNGECYDLREVALSESPPRITVGPARYFDMIDYSEALAHELAAGSRGDRPTADLAKRLIRKSVGDPFDLRRRPCVPAIACLTLFRSQDGTAEFILHDRDGGQVASAGGLIHVVPGGQFSPYSKATIDMAEHASIWSTFEREFAEELLGVKDAEGEGSAGPDIASFPFAELRALKASGHLSLWFLGITMDPLTLWPDVLAVAVLDRDAALKALPPLRTLETRTEGKVLGLSLLLGPSVPMSPHP